MDSILDRTRLGQQEKAGTFWEPRKEKPEGRTVAVAPLSPSRAKFWEHLPAAHTYLKPFEMTALSNLGTGVNDGWLLLPCGGMPLKLALGMSPCCVHVPGWKSPSMFGLGSRLTAAMIR